MLPVVTFFAWFAVTWPMPISTALAGWVMAIGAAFTIYFMFHIRRKP